MILSLDRVSCDDFGDCHDEITVAGVDFIGKRPICDLCLQGEGCFWALPTRTATSGHRSHRRWSWRGNQGLEMMNLHHRLYLAMQLSKFFYRFRCVLDWFRSVGSCGMFNVLGLAVGFGWHKGCILALAFEGSHWGRRRWKNLNSILCLFYFKFLCLI